MSKKHPLDCRASGGAACQRAPLEHSVSIVVELAREARRASESRPTVCAGCRCAAGPVEGPERRNGWRRPLESGGVCSPCEGACGNGTLEAAKSPPWVIDEDEGDGPASKVDGERRQSPSWRARQPLGPETRQEEEEREREGEAEAEACLRSELARKVVLVDEAERIQCGRNRARSAEPGLLSAQLSGAALLGRRGQSSCAAGAPLGLQWGDWGGLGGRTLSLGWSSGAACCPACAAASGAPQTVCGGGGAGTSAAGGSSTAGELAERGALCGPGMRRNTHHSVNIVAGPPTLGLGANSSPAAARRSSPGRETPARGPQTLCGSHTRGYNLNFSLNLNLTPTATTNTKPNASPKASPNTNTNTNTNQNPNQKQPNRHLSLATQWAGQASSSNSNSKQQQLSLQHHRRQSLQVSVWSSGHLQQQQQQHCKHCHHSSRDASRSLTEEELRGEREFNRQVRSAARLPQEFNPLLNQQLRQAATSSAAAAASHRLGLATKRLDQPPSQQSSQQRAEEEQSQWSAGSQASGSQRPRRVSFGSVESIGLARGECGSPSAPLAQLAAGQTEAWGRFGPAGTEAELVAGGILRHGERASLSAATTSEQQQKRADFSGSPGEQQGPSVKRNNRPLASETPSGRRASSAAALHWQSEWRAASEQPASASTRETANLCPTQAQQATDYLQRDADYLEQNADYLQCRVAHEPQQAASEAALESPARRAINDKLPQLTSGRQPSSWSSAATWAATASPTTRPHSDVEGDNSAPRGEAQTEGADRQQLETHFPALSGAELGETMDTSGSSGATSARASEQDGGATSGGASAALRRDDLGAQVQSGVRRARFASVAGETGASGRANCPEARGALQRDHQAALMRGQEATSSEEMDRLVAAQAARKHQSKSIGGDAHEASRVQSIMASARMRQEEFARLLEEHEQIVNEINRFETKISTKQVRVEQDKQTQFQEKQNQEEKLDDQEAARSADASP